MPIATPTGVNVRRRVVSDTEGSESGSPTSPVPPQPHSLAPWCSPRRTPSGDHSPGVRAKVMVSGGQGGPKGEQVELASYRDDDDDPSSSSAPYLTDSANPSESGGMSEPLLAREGEADRPPATQQELPDGPKKEESFMSIAFQVFFPYVVAGFGTVGAGMVLDVVQHWDVFKVVSEIFILAPALLGLKGNLEMTLASRLSTQANLGNMDEGSKLRSMVVGNLTLTQAQALVVGLLASVAAMIMGWIPKGKFDVGHGLILCTSSMLTASLASLILGLLMIGIVVLSRKCRINPDNIATPVAASLGDLTTLTLLANISNMLYSLINSHQMWLVVACLVICILFIPLWLVMSRKNSYVSEVVVNGWTPVICAMAISSVGGLILDMALSGAKTIFVGMAIYQPVMSGVGGNLVAVQSSRMSTELHQSATLGTLPPDQSSGCANPLKAFFGSRMTAKTCRVLLLMVIPGHLIFLGTIKFMGAGHTSLSVKFVSVYLLAALIQVTVLLYVCQWMVRWMWAHGDDPDNFAIPYLTALGDLLGISLLALTFYLLYISGDRDADVAD